MSIPTGCYGLQPASHGANPLGWPSKGLYAAGWTATSTELPLLRELGALLYALGDLTDSPALLIEGLATFNGDKLAGSGEKLLVGTGGTITAALNVPTFFITGETIDLGRDADAINAALAHIEKVDPEVWRLTDSDERPYLFVPGTRVRAFGNQLIWTIPNQGQVIQTATHSPWFQLVLALFGKSNPAQERTWGMVVKDPDDWNSWRQWSRARTIIHEFYHQHYQLRERFYGWSIAFWPAYGVDYLRTGWSGHWAENGSRIGAASTYLPMEEWKQLPERTPVGEVADPEAVLAAVEADLVSIPGGTYQVGSERPFSRQDPSQVDVGPFRIARHEVTQQLFDQVMGFNPSGHPNQPGHPVEQVTLEEARLFCQRLNQVAGQTRYRLPDHTEWEVACRAGADTTYGFGDDPAGLDAHAWWEGNASGQSHPVGTRAANPWGLFDLHGNVAEWCDGAEGVRGGSWTSDAIPCEAAVVARVGPKERYPSVGFRIAAAPLEEP